MMSEVLEDTSGLPSVTVIIPCFNRGAFLRQTVDSALAQTWRNVEVIVVDDGSTDDSAQILDAYGDRIRVLTHPGRENKGQSASINLGLSSSTSDYVAILDSDDWWEVDKLRVQVEFLESNPKIGLVYCNGYQVAEDGTRKWRMYSDDHQEHSDPARVLADCYFLVPNNSLIRRAVIDETGGFDESLRAAQDHDMAIRIAEVAKIAYLPVDVFNYRRHDDSISKKNTRLRWSNGFIILDKASNRYPYRPREIRKRRAVLHFRMGQVLMSERALLRAGARFLLAFINDPMRGLRVVTGRERISAPSS